MSNLIINNAALAITDTSQLTATCSGVFSGQLIVYQPCYINLSLFSLGAGISYSFTIGGVSVSATVQTANGQVKTKSSTQLQPGTYLYTINPINCGGNTSVANITFTT